MIQIGYGKADYKELITRGFYYVDRTQFLEVLGEQAEEWIRDDKNKQNGRMDFNNLRLHFEGEGNVSHQIILEISLTFIHTLVLYV